MSPKRKPNRSRSIRKLRNNRVAALAYLLVRFPIEIPKGRKLRVLIYARYRTVGQNPSSIAAQIEYCKQIPVSLGIHDFDLTVIEDRELSGELVERPGVDKVREGIEAQSWELVLCEDSSRLFRNVTACLTLVGRAVDQKVRVLCINDDVDTADEDNWQDRLHEAQSHHTRSNRYTAKRIKRAHTALWEMGAAITHLHPGYQREATHPETVKEPAEGPFFDEADSEWAPIVHEAFERIAANESSSTVARWLTDVDLPKISNSLREEWTAKNVVSMIRNSIYSGVEYYRTTVTKKRVLDRQAPSASKRGE